VFVPGDPQGEDVSRPLFLPSRHDAVGGFGVRVVGDHIIVVVLKCRLNERLMYIFIVNGENIVLFL